MLTTLTNAIGAIWSHFSMNVRLCIEYLMIAAIVIIGAYTYSLYVDRKLQASKIETLQVKVDTATDVNKAQTENIQSLADQRAKDNEFFLSLKTLTDKVNQDTHDRIDKTQALKQTNQVVKNYLDQPVPADLARLYGRAANPAGGNKTPARTTP